MTFSREEKSHFLQLLAGLGDRLPSNLIALEQAGFARPAIFMARRREYFLIGCAETDCSEEAFLLEQIEEVKEDVGNANSTQWIFGDADGYRSPLFEARRQLRDRRLGQRLTTANQNAVGEAWQHWPIVWRQSWDRSRCLDRNEFNIKTDLFLERLDAVKCRECASFDRMVDMKSITLHFDEMLEPYGFGRSLLKSSHQTTVWTRAIGRSMCIAFRLSTKPLRNGCLRLRCYLEHSYDVFEAPFAVEATGGVKKVPIKFAAAVPDFDWAYRSFDGEKELAVSIAAIVWLYAAEEQYILECAKAFIAS